jgi:hypothetical protein
MVNTLDVILEEIEALRNRMHELYLQKRSLRNRHLLKTSEMLDRKINIHQQLMRYK